MALKLRSKVQFPASVVGSGGIMVSKSNGAWTVEPDFPALATIVASAVSNPTSKQVWIYDPTTGEYNTLTLADLGNALYVATSTSSIAIGTGSKTFTTQSGKDFGVGAFVIATSDADPTNYMLGQVTTYSSTSLTMTVTETGGSGTFADWTLRLSAPASSGKSAGFSYKWSTDTTSSDPTAGFIKANNATFASITSLYLSETDFDANNLAAEIATWDDSTSVKKGRVEIYDPITPSNFMTFDVTALTDNGAWDTLTVSPVASGGTLTNSLAVRVEFTASGDAGSGYAATSTTSLLIGTGSKSFTTQAGLAYKVGARVRASSAANTTNWMEGLVTSYSSTTLVVNIDKTNGSGTLADWNLNIAGQPGAGDLTSSNNLSDVASAQTSRANLGIEVATGHGDSIYSILATDLIVYTNAAFTASRTWTMPAANGVNAGRRLWVIDIQGTVTSTNTLVIARNGTDTLQDVSLGTGQTSITLTHALEAICFESDGSSKWTVVEWRRTHVRPDASSQLSAGFYDADSNQGSKSSGTFTPDPSTMPNIIYYTNAGAHTLAPWSATGKNATMIIDILNGASSGAITTSGWTKVDGDGFDTTSTSKFRCYASVSQAGSHLNVKKMA